ncbi:MAG: cellulase family glycosylhydrolase [Actinobacteria bacterium]|nr:cellulase family glycosylhydrolase [Actinomycetota bacterium]
MPSSLVGMHIEGAEAGAWASAPFGALRLWDNGTAWSQIELEPGVYKWDNLEGILENAQAKGMTDILMVLGTTPEWNAKKIGPDDYPQPGAASAPKDLKAWDAWVTEVATRYKGRITAYQIWNEANLKNFWNGTPEEMAELTKRAYDIIKAIDPAALVVAASPSTRLTGPFDKFFPAYLDALAAKDWPIDVVAIHTYPAADGDPAARGAIIKLVQDYLTAAGAPDLPLWDTELNYGLAGPGDLPKQEITTASIARTGTSGRRSPTTCWASRRTRAPMRSRASSRWRTGSSDPPSTAAPTPLERSPATSPRTAPRGSSPGRRTVMPPTRPRPAPSWSATRWRTARSHRRALRSRSPRSRSGSTCSNGG